MVPQDASPLVSVVRSGVALLVGATSGVLCARLVVKLLAGRPDNPVFRALTAASDPLVAPLAVLNEGQPRFGAVLEFSTLAALFFVLAAGYIVWQLLPRGTPQ